MRKSLSRFLLAVYLPVGGNIVLLWRLSDRALTMQGAGPLFRWGVLMSGAAAGMLLSLYLHISPAWDKVKTGFRLRMMRRGRTLVYCGLYALTVQVFLFLWFYPRLIAFREAGGYVDSTFTEATVLAVNGIWAVISGFLYLANGVIRIFCTSRRLSIVRRLVMLLTMWIPLVNLAVLLYACRLVGEEYGFERDKVLLRELRADSHICATRYPLLMVHGIGFRDLRYFNYWGRIPRELMRNGARIFYGNQEALGTAAYNAEDIRQKIFEVLKETGSEKVNIIAHSKGGLDARYAISKLGMAPYVATLTTMNTPHQGCRFVDYACRLPEWLYRFVAGCFDRTFRKFGDRNPDFYTATHQFSTRETQLLNEKMPNMPGVYYQSYTSKMKYAWSHLLLAIPYCMIWPLEGENDGLVSVTSAELKWKGEINGSI